jgi:hypothetical protein
MWKEAVMDIPACIWKDRGKIRKNLDATTEPGKYQMRKRYILIHCSKTSRRC